MASLEDSKKQDIPEVQRRQRSLALVLKDDYNKYIRLGRWNYYCALTIRWLSAAAGLVAGFFGLTNFASSATVGGIAAAAGILLAFGRDLKFQQKANWHYQRAEGTARFQNRLEYQVPESPHVDNIAEVAADYNRFSQAMTNEWKENIAFDDTPRSAPTQSPGNG
jgi:hypothetical protein